MISKRFYFVWIYTQPKAHPKENAPPWWGGALRAFGKVIVRACRLGRWRAREGGGGRAYGRGGGAFVGRPGGLARTPTCTLSHISAHRYGRGFAFAPEGQSGSPAPSAAARQGSIEFPFAPVVRIPGGCVTAACISSSRRLSGVMCAPNFRSIALTPADTVGPYASARFSCNSVSLIKNPFCAPPSSGYFGGRPGLPGAAAFVRISSP